MRQIFISLIAVFIAGCASTPSELVTGGSDLSLHSKKSAKNVAMCIYLKWEDTRGVVVSQRETTTGYRILINRESELGQMVDVDQLKDGASTKFYNRHLVIGGNPWKDAVIECQ